MSHGRPSTKLQGPAVTVVPGLGPASLAAEVGGGTGPLTGGPHRGIHVPHPETRGKGPPRHPLDDNSAHGLRAVSRGPTSCASQRLGYTPRHMASICAGGSVNGARVTAVLLELAQLKGWNLAGLGVDYVNCFDTIPHIVVPLPRTSGHERQHAAGLGGLFPAAAVRLLARRQPGLGRQWRRAGMPPQRRPHQFPYFHLKNGD